jgi:hypothetical protein
MQARRLASTVRLGLFAIALAPVLAACVVETGSEESTGERDDAVTENAEDHIAFDYFVAKGLTDVQAAGIVGNLDQESGMDPKAVQPGGPGRGIAQWSVGERWNGSKGDNVAWYAAKHGGSAWSLGTQLDFIWYELTNLGYGYDELRAAKTVTQAVLAFQDHYEMCGQCASSNRIAHAKAALAKFGGASGDQGGAESPAPAKPPPASDPASPSPGPSDPPSGPACSVGGVEGTCIDVSACAAMPGYESTAGHCPGPASEQCCTPPPACHVGGVGGSCIEVSLCASLGKTSTPGHCGGPANIECCTP